MSMSKEEHPARMVAMQDLAAGRSVARRASSDRVLAFITGIASLDIVPASEIYGRAARLGRGRRLDLTDLVGEITN